MYPLKFKPILKQTLWGGDKIISFKHLEDKLPNVGESWEISGVKDNESVVANGEYRGRTLPQLVREFKEVLVGDSNYRRFGETFPLLIKFIDAQKDLSIQVHPSDELAKIRHNSLGKTEMWYVVGADKGAKLISGFSKQITQKEYKERIACGTIMDVLKQHEIHSGDVFFTPAGRVHSIGAGALIAEIQETSDVTYRIYDFDRKDANGNPRELHTELAKDAIDYEVLDDYRTHYESEKNEPVELAACTNFTTSLYDVDEEISCDYSELDSFVILMCVEGACTLKTDNEESIELQAGETVLIAAENDEMTIIPHDSAKILESYV